jgi:hypothetical protein
MGGGDLCSFFSSYDFAFDHESYKRVYYTLSQSVKRSELQSLFPNTVMHRRQDKRKK